MKSMIKKYRDEVRKTVFPDRKKIVKDTAIVVITCSVFALGFFLVDSGLLYGLKALVR